MLHNRNLCPYVNFEIRRVTSLQNPRYSFWSQSFTRCAPEIEKLFESVARSCGGKAAEDGMGLPEAGH
jgi:CCR4-NOT transcription complex subunit 1